MYHTNAKVVKIEGGWEYRGTLYFLFSFFINLKLF